MTDAQPTEKRTLELSWEALEDAFENNAPEVHSYLHVYSGEVLRVVDGVADPAMHQRIAVDTNYLRVDPVSSREQYRWMERFIPTVTEPELRGKLVAAIDGKGAFRRFKDVLMAYPAAREKWFEFRTERLKGCMEAWLESHGLAAVPRAVWAPPVDAAGADVEADAAALRRARAAVEALRKRVREAVELVPNRELDTALAFLEFLRERGASAGPSVATAAESEGASGARSDGAG